MKIYDLPELDPLVREDILARINHPDSPRLLEEALRKAAEEKREYDESLKKAYLDNLKNGRFLV